jgi:hypothetical protein
MIGRSLGYEKDTSLFLERVNSHHPAPRIGQPSTSARAVFLIPGISLLAIPDMLS